MLYHRCEEVLSGRGVMQGAGCSTVGVRKCGVGKRGVMQGAKHSAAGVEYVGGGGMQGVGRVAWGLASLPLSFFPPFLSL